MANDFRIRFTLKTVKGFEPMCDFYIGSNRDIALALFNELDGSDEVREVDLLQLDFIEIRNGLPVNIKIKHCTLLQMSSNCILIAREIFKYRNLVGIL
ncbi:MAG: hypothetical protein ACHQEM_07655 [Chitinophagales bacterium]